MLSVSLLHGRHGKNKLILEGSLVNCILELTVRIAQCLVSLTQTSVDKVYFLERQDEDLSLKITILMHKG